LTKEEQQLTWGLALLGQDVGTLAEVRYQLRLRLDVIILALVHIFNFKPFGYGMTTIERSLKEKL
jgi:hypothetical protein